MTYTVKVTREKVNEAIAKIDKMGEVTVHGKRGSFEVKGVEGDFAYDFPTQVLTIDITRKPLFATEKLVKLDLDKFFK